MRKLYTYMGSKDRHLDLLNSIIENSNAKNYCEPFLGSGSVFLNLKKDFEKYYLNDLQIAQIVEKKDMKIGFLHVMETMMRSINEIYCRFVA